MIYTLVKKNADETIDSIISFDSITSFDESWSATVTTQTVETGFDVTDNINIEPEVYSIDAVISSYSLFDLDRELVWDGVDFVSSGETDNLRHVKVRDKIKDIFKSRSILKLIESNVNSNNSNLEYAYGELTSGYFNEIPNCVITSMGISHPQSGSGAFYVSLKVQKVHVAKVATFELSESDLPKELIALKQKTESVPSNASVVGSAGSVESGLPDAAAIEASDIGAAVSKVDGGISFEVGAAQARSELRVLENEYEAAQIGAAMTAKTGNLTTPDHLGGGVYGLKAKVR